MTGATRSPAARGMLVAAVATLLALVPLRVAHAQPVPGDDTAPPLTAPPDSAAAATDSTGATADSTAGAPLRGVTVPFNWSPASSPPDTTSVPHRARRDRLELDRFELGVASVKGPFDLLGTFAYHRFLFEGGPFEQSMHIEVSYGKAGYLKEGAVSLGYLLRPLATYRPSWRIRPIVEGGPALHVVFQAAEIVGFSENAFHEHAYLKSHGILGLEALLTDRWGIVVRGRITAPAHRPLDYAQAAIFLR